MLDWLWNAIGLRSKEPSDTIHVKVKSPENTQVTETLAVNDSVTSTLNTPPEPIDTVEPQETVEPHETVEPLETVEAKETVAIQSGYTKARNTIQKAIELYCPYRDCTYSNSIKSTLYDHIQRQHSNEFKKIANPKVTRNLRSLQTGESVQLSDPKGTLDPDDRITDKRLYFCPYQSCSKVFHLKNDIIEHIQTKHHPKVLRRSKQYRTKDSNTIITFSNQDRSMVSHGEYLYECDKLGNIRSRRIKLNEASVVNDQIDKPSTPSKRQATPEEEATEERATRSSKRRRRNPLAGNDMWELY